MTHWLIIGAGVSGLGAAKFLRGRGESVRVSERSRLPSAKAEPFLRVGAEVLDGGHELSHLDDITDIVVSPGLPGTHPLLVEARRRSIRVVSEIDLALAFYQGTVIAVTGTNGKSTTCAMIGHLLARSGHSVTVGGNFGDPPTAMLAEERATDFLVLELSSYQLEQSKLVAPAVAILTSFSFDHIARHGSMSAYLAAKWSVFARQPKGALALVPSGIVALARKNALPEPQGLQPFNLDGAKLIVPGRTPLDLSAFGVLEVHNQLNAALALLTVEHLTDRSAESLAPLLAGFRGLPHRCELVATRDGRPIVNDSKSTNLESTLVALASQTDPVILMMGGQGKGESYAPLLHERAKIAALVTFGASGPEIAAAARGQVPVLEFPTLKAALAAIDGIMETYRRGLLFSPGCASFDEFENYGHRGDVFTAAVNAGGGRS